MPNNTTNPQLYCPNTVFYKKTCMLQITTYKVVSNISGYGKREKGKWARGRKQKLRGA